MSVYSVHKLMKETRRLAREYHRATGQALPVSVELARYDACCLLGLEKVDGQPGVDAVGTSWARDRNIQIKGRVIFDEAKSGHRIGQLNFEAEWELLLLLIMDGNYDCQEIYCADKIILQDEMNQAAKNKRGALTIAKLKNIGELVWRIGDGLISDQLWENHSGSD